MTVTGPAHRAHYRLLQSGLPARTHRRPELPAPKWSREGLQLGVRRTTIDTTTRVRALQSEGLTGREIARRLKLSEATVSRHRAR